MPTGKRSDCKLKMEFNNFKAALFVVIAMSMITTNDAIVKHLTHMSRPRVKDNSR